MQRFWQVLGLVFLAASAQAQTDAFRAYVEERMTFHEVVGASVVIVDNAEIKAVLSLGHAAADVAAPVTPDSVFQIGSVSKPVAAWAILTLVDAGKLDLDEPVATYLTRWQLPPSEFDHTGITLRRLLSHTGGLSLSGYPGFREGTPVPSIEASLSGDTGGSGAVFVMQPPGESFSYSGGGYTLMQLIVEEISGEPFSQYAERAVLEPLGMTSSSYEPDTALRERLVQPHGHTRNVIPHHNFRAQAAASLHATGPDIARFVIANVSQNDVLSPADVTVMHTPIADTGSLRIGLGFFVSEDGVLVGHSGSNFGWKANMQFAPASGDGIVVLTNSESGGAFGYEVACRWDAEFGPAAMEASCSDYFERQQETTRLMQAIAAVTALLTLIVALSALARLVKGSHSLSLPATWARGFLALGCVLSGLLWGIALYTPAGAYLVSGVWPIFPTIDFLPRSFRWVSISVLCLFAALIGWFCLKPRPAKT